MSALIHDFLWKMLLHRSQERVLIRLLFSLHGVPAPSSTRGYRDLYCSVFNSYGCVHHRMRQKKTPEKVTQKERPEKDSEEQEFFSFTRFIPGIKRIKKFRHDCLSCLLVSG